MKSKVLKYWGGALQYKGDQGRSIICAYTIKDAVVFLNEVSQCLITYKTFKDYWCETGNNVELSLLKNEGDIYFSKEDMPWKVEDYIKIR